MITIQEINSNDEFNMVKREWHELLKKTDNDSLFLSHEWFECCVRGFQENKELMILLIKDGKSIIGIAPLWLYKDTERSVLVRKLGFIYTPDSPIADFIVVSDKREAVLKAILDYLYNKKRKFWDIFTLNQWPKKSPNYETLQKIVSSKNIKYFIQISSLTPYISIKENWESFLQGRSVKFRKTHRNIINRINKLTNVEVRCYQNDINGTLLRDLVHVSKRSWKDKAGLSFTSHKTSMRFFEALSDMAEQKGWLFVWLLNVDNVPIAMEYDLTREGKVYALRADFDDEYKKYSPGVYLEYQIIKHFFEERYREYNTGPGMNDYKMHWTDQVNENITYQMFNNNVKGLYIWALETKMYPFLRSVRDIKMKIIKDQDANE